MAFSEKSLVLQCEAPQGATDGTAPGGAMRRKWWYPTADAFATVATAGYFNNARARLRVGDIVEVSCASNKGGLYTFSAVPASGNVTVVASVLA